MQAVILHQKIFCFKSRSPRPRRARARDDTTALNLQPTITRTLRPGIHCQSLTRFRPLGYMKTPIIRSSFAVRSVHLREPQLPVESTANALAWPARVMEISRFFIPMTDATHLFNKGSAHSIPGLSSKGLLAAPVIFVCNLPRIRGLPIE